MEESNSPEIKSHPAKKDNNKKKWLIILLIALLVVAGAGAYLWRDKQAKEDLQAKQDEVSSLQEEVDKLNSDIAKLSKELADEKNSESSTATTPSAADLENIQASITSKNTAALEGYMADSVNFILAASEGIGPQTPTQAIASLDQQLASTKDPWSFNLPAATLSSYSSGSYAQYFPDGALVGKSANDVVISITFDENAKISGIFVGTDEIITQ